MGWTSPFTAVAGSAFSAAQFNQFVRDNLLETAPAKATSPGSFFTTVGLNTIIERHPRTAYVDASETTASTSFVALTTAGPTIGGIVTGSTALIMLTCSLSNNTAGSGARMGYAISGATTLAANDVDSLAIESGVAGDEFSASWVNFWDGLTVGTQTFTSQYKAYIGGTATFRRRRMGIIPF